MSAEKKVEVLMWIFHELEREKKDDVDSADSLKVWFIERVVNKMQYYWVQRGADGS